MLLRSSLVQIIGLILGLLVVSFMSVPGLTMVLAQVRGPLLMVLGVAMFYLALMLSHLSPMELAKQDIEPEVRERY